MGTNIKHSKLSSNKYNKKSNRRTNINRTNLGDYLIYETLSKQ